MSTSQRRLEQHPQHQQWQQDLQRRPVRHPGRFAIGFRGTEALGNGLSAIFTLEYSLTIDDNTGVGTSNGNGGLNARQQFVGLQSDKLVTVALGRQYAPGYVATVNNDVLAGSSLGSQSILSSQAGNTITPNTAARWNNAATYTSPTGAASPPKRSTLSARARPSPRTGRTRTPTCASTIAIFPALTTADSVLAATTPTER
jgi:predicted porin